MAKEEEDFDVDFDFEDSQNEESTAPAIVPDEEDLRLGDKLIKAFNSIVNWNGKISKQNISTVAKAISSKILDESDAVPDYIIVKAMHSTLDEVIKTVKEKTIKSASKYHKEESFYMGASFAVKQGKRNYSFEGDKTMEALIKQKAEIDKKIKERQDLMKKAIGSDQFVFDGEIIPPAKVTYDEDSIAVEFIKK